MLDQDNKLSVEKSNATPRVSEIQEETKKEFNQEIEILADKIEGEVDSEITESNVAPQVSEAQKETQEELNQEMEISASKTGNDADKEVTESISILHVSEIKEEEQKEVKVKKNTSTSKAVDEMDSEIAESSENIEHKTIEMLDYADFSLEELVAELGKLVKENKVQNITNNVNAIKQAFHVKYGERKILGAWR